MAPPPRPPGTFPGRLPRALYELAFAWVTLAIALPLLATRHVPLQDLPQHMAAISVLRRLPFDPVLREYFVPTLSRTQYLLVYALGVPLSVPFGVAGAAKLLAVATVVSLPYALRFVLRRTGGDEALAALAWPLAWNPQMMLGFLNFLLGIPIALFALGLFADRAARGTARRQVALAVLALAAFYSHLVPFGLLGLGTLLLLHFDATGSLPPAAPARDRARALARDLRTVLRETLFLVPALVAALVWILRTPAADASVRAGGVGVTPHPEWPALASLPRDLSATVLDFPGDLDERALLAWGLAALAALALARRSLTLRPPTTPPSTRHAVAAGVGPLVLVLAYLARHHTFAWIWGPGRAPEATWAEIATHAAEVWAIGVFVALALTGLSALDDAPRVDFGVETERARAGARLAWLPVACGVLYLCTPTSYGWIWPIHTRFAVTAALVLPLLVAAIRPVAAALALTAVLAVASLGLAGDVADRFVRWDATELGDIDAALAHALPGRRLVALVPAMASGLVPNVPLLHAAAYYQVRGGAVAAFSFADFPQSPFRYRENGPRPPRLPPRWEWNTDLRVADPAMDYYDYVLVRRGAMDEAAAHPDRYRVAYQGGDWTLYERRVHPGGR